MAMDARRSFFELLGGANERHETYHIRHRGGRPELGLLGVLSHGEGKQSKPLSGDLT